MTDRLDLTMPIAVHVIGIGGAGMRAIASVLAAMGHTVTGSDLRESPGLDRLRAEGIEVTIGHAVANVGQVDLVTRSTAVPDANPEVGAAKERDIPVVSRAETLAAITRVRPTIAVAGTHGKTTTSSMLAVVLREAGLDPSFIIGGELNEVGSGAVWTDSDGWFVVEADESDGTFLRLAANRAIVTSVEPDHLGHFGDEAALIESFAAFAEGVGSGGLVVCADDAGAAALATDARVSTYGTDPGADWVISDYESGRAASSFRLVGPHGFDEVFELATPGLHNVRNATAAIVSAHQLGADVDALRQALAKFGGVARRFQYRGARDGVTFIDDYAHLPAEVEAALEAASNGGWDRVVCVFQPHRYTRTRDLWESFGTAFEGADEVVVTGIYAAGEAPMPGVTGKLIVDAVAKSDSSPPVTYLPHREELRTYLRARLQAGDLCLTLGAGDLTTLADELLLP